MSTRAIRIALELLRLRQNDGPASIKPLVDEAFAKVEAIERACSVVVREDALEDWTSAGPDELGESIRLIQRIAKEAA